MAEAISYAMRALSEALLPRDEDNVPRSPVDAAPARALLANADADAPSTASTVELRTLTQPHGKSSHRTYGVSFDVCCPSTEREGIVVHAILVGGEHGRLRVLTTRHAESLHVTGWDWRRWMRVPTPTEPLPPSLSCAVPLVLHARVPVPAGAARGFIVVGEVAEAVCTEAGFPA